MTRTCFTIVAVLTAASVANASFHEFTLNSYTQTTPASPLIPISVVDPTFTLPDTPNQVVGTTLSIYYPLEQMSVSVDSVVLPLYSAFVGNGGVNLNFSSNFGSAPLWTVRVSGLGNSYDDPFPSFTSPNPPFSTWEWLPVSTEVDPVADGKLSITVAVPEPSALGFGAIALGLVGMGRFIGRRFKKIA